ncbi:MAG: phage portal protein [Aliihoeflea sp.]|uniref:phage portal protein n=1 Tax=Aliihoeflea sp. TaxID=2608088 RepID=UPI004034D764
MNGVERLRTYDDAELERKIGQSSHGGIYKKPRLAGDEDSVFDEDEQGAEIFQAMQPGEWLQVPEGWDVEFSQPSQTDANYALFRREGLAGLSVALGLAVEMVTLNFEKVGNERIYRAIMIEVWRHIESLQFHMFVQQMCEPVWKRFVAAAYEGGVWKPADGLDIEDYYDVEWMVPKREHIHPEQEINAIVKKIQAGVLSRKRAVNAEGEDVDVIDAENAVDRAAAEKLGMTYSVYLPPAAAPAQSPEAGVGDNPVVTRSLVDAVADYGVAVRAGAITPQIEDEEAFRKALTLPSMSSSVTALWHDQHGYRAPTLARPGGEMPFGGAGAGEIGEEAG